MFVPLNHSCRLIFLEETLPFPFIAGIVRMSRKYNFTKLLAAAVDRLTHDNPVTLEKVDELQLISGIKHKSIKQARITEYRGIVFNTITLARENNLVTVLPCAHACAALFAQVQSRYIRRLPAN